MSKVTAECNLSFHPQSIQIGEIFSFGGSFYLHSQKTTAPALPASVLNENFAEVQVNNCCWWMFGKVFMIEPKVKLESHSANVSVRSVMGPAPTPPWQPCRGQPQCWPPSTSSSSRVGHAWNIIHLHLWQLGMIRVAIKCIFHSIAFAMAGL